MSTPSPFAALGQPNAIVSATEQAGYTQPTPVQQEAIPAALAGEDLLVSSQTGSGKTAAFALPLLARLAAPRRNPTSRGARVLVLTPTRELAQQVEKAFRTYGKGLKRLKTVTLVGGVPYGPQRRDLAGFVDVIVATPGRLKDHLNSRTLTLDSVEALVLDEADRMLDMGFIDDIREIAAQIPATRQTLLFSATLDGVVGQLAEKLTRSPRRIEIARTPEAAPKIAERIHYFDNETHKEHILSHLLTHEEIEQAVIFTATKRSAEALAERLAQEGVRAAALHGDMAQRARSRVVERLRRGEVQVLVATDVAARGLDIAGISHVINFDPPKQFEDYVHRIGRTGRAGREGVAITLVHPNEGRLIQGIGRFVGRTLPEAVIPGLEPRLRRAVTRFHGPRSDGAPRPNGSRSNDAAGRRVVDSRSPRWEAPRQSRSCWEEPRQPRGEGRSRWQEETPSRSRWQKERHREYGRWQTKESHRHGSDGHAQRSSRPILSLKK